MGVLDEIRVERAPRPAWAPMRLERAHVALGGIFLLALVMRLVQLGEKPLHHDESIHAWFAWRLFSGDGYEYDPTYHGPVQFYLYTLAYFLFGVSDTAVRVAPALVGSAMTLLPWFLRAQLGRVAALTACALLAISPSYLYFSRFAREDIFVATITLGLVVLVFRFLRRPQRWQPAAILGLLAASFATKETTYITVFVAGTFFLGAIVLESVRSTRAGLPWFGGPIVTAIRSVGGEAWVWGATSFALVFTLLFSTFLVNPQGLRDGVWESIDYWLSQHPVNRGGQPWFYYLFALPAYELPIVLLALGGAVVCLRRRQLLGLFLVYDAVLSLVVYSWAGERMPWLILHPLLPLVLLAGVGFQALWQASPRARRVAIVAVAPLSVLVLLHGATAVVYHHPADPAEVLVFTQNSTDVLPVRDTILQLERQATIGGDEHASVLIDDWGGTSWPWAWYFRDQPIRYASMDRPTPTDGADAVIVSESNLETMRPLLTDYVGRRFRLREWWVVDFAALRPGALWRWFLRREPWSPKGSQNQYLYVRRDNAGAAADPATASVP